MRRRADGPGLVRVARTHQAEADSPKISTCPARVASAPAAAPAPRPVPASRRGTPVPRADRVPDRGVGRWPGPARQAPTRPPAAATERGCAGRVVISSLAGNISSLAGRRRAVENCKNFNKPQSVFSSLNVSLCQFSAKGCLLESGLSGCGPDALIVTNVIRGPSSRHLSCCRIHTPMGWEVSW